MKKILVIAGAGRLGSCLSSKLSYRADCEVTSLIREDVDIRDAKKITAIIRNIEPAIIINCAAYNGVDKAEERNEITAAYQVNACAVSIIAQAAAAVGAKFVHYSTSYVFAGSEIGGCAEHDAPSPLSVYGKSKLIGEYQVQNSIEEHYIIRTQWLYGGNTGSKPSFVELMLNKAAEGKEIKCLNNEFGQPTNVEDLADATLDILDNEREYGIYHVANAGCASWYDWADEIFRLKGIDIKLKKVSGFEKPRAAQRPVYGYFKNTKLLPLRPWQEALREYLVA